MPVPESAADLSKGRVGDGNRSFAAYAGLSVATLCVHQAAWLLRTLRPVAQQTHSLTFDWRAWPPRAGPPQILVWEAFVAGAAHSEAHVRDAATAAVAFAEDLTAASATSAVTASNPLSLMGAVVIWSGWSEDIELLRSPVLVIKPTEPFTGPIDAV